MLFVTIKVCLLAWDERFHPVEMDCACEQKSKFRHGRGPILGGIWTSTKGLPWFWIGKETQGISQTIQADHSCARFVYNTVSFKLYWLGKTQTSKSSRQTTPSTKPSYIFTWVCTLKRPVPTIQLRKDLYVMTSKQVKLCYLIKHISITPNLSSIKNRSFVL